MHATRLFRAAVAAIVLSPLLAGTAQADTPPSANAQSASATADSSATLSADASDSTSDMLQFSRPGETRLAADYRTHQLTAKQFISIGLSGLFGGSVPAAYQDDAPAAADVDTSGDDGANAASVAWDPEFMQYLFAVVGTQSADDQAAFAQAFSPTSADGSAPSAIGAADTPTQPATTALTGQPVTPAATAAASIPAAAPTSPFCQHPFVTGVRTPFGFPRIRSLSYQCGVATPHFTIYFTLSSHDKHNGVPDADTFGVAATSTGLVRTTTPDGLPDYIDNVALSMENAYAYYTSQGYNTPPKNITVLISSQLSSGLTPPPIAGHQYISLPNTDSQNSGSQIEMPYHEVFHTFQYRYISDFDLATNLPTMNWWMEATAQWAAHHAMLASGQSLIDTNGQNEEPLYASSLPDYLGAPSESLDAWAGFGGGRQYGAFIFAEYLSGKFGNQAVLDTWQHIGQGYLPVGAIEKTFTDYGTTTGVELPEYAKAVYQLGPDAGTSTTICVLDYSGSNPLDGTDGCGANQYPQIVQTGGGYSSNQFQFTDPDVAEWIAALNGDTRTDSQSPVDPARAAPRPLHGIAQLNPSGGVGQQISTIGPGGMAFTDLVWSGAQAQQLQITIAAPKRYLSQPHGGRQIVPVALHASLIGWSSYRTRCGFDQEATISTPGASATVTFPSLSGCSFATLVLTDTEAQQPGRAVHLSYTWSSRLLGTEPVVQ